MSQENMNREEQGIRILEALSGVDEELLARCEEAGGKTAGKNSSNILSFWRKYGKLCAACLCLVFLGTAFWGISMTQKSSTPSEAASTNFAFADASPKAEMSAEPEYCAEEACEAGADAETFGGSTVEDRSNNTGDLGPAWLVNPLTELTEEELLDIYGIAVTLPKTADNVTYWTIDGDGLIYECRFTDKLTEMKEHLSAAPETKEQESSRPEVRLRICKTYDAEDISGMYYSWTEIHEVADEAGECLVALTGEGQGICTWYEDGYSFAISMTEGANEEYLLACRKTIAETIVLPK